MVKLVNANPAESPGTRIEGDVLYILRRCDDVKLASCRIADCRCICHANGRPGGTTYSSFTGYLGRGAAHFMSRVGEVLWLLVCPRSMDGSGLWSFEETGMAKRRELLLGVGLLEALAS